MSLPEQPTALRPHEEPFYLPVGDEVVLFERCHARGLAVSPSLR